MSGWVSERQMKFQVVAIFKKFNIQSPEVVNTILDA